MSLIYRLVNKPWEWRAVLAEYRRRRDADWELVDFWHAMNERTCQGCLREIHRPTGINRVCRSCLNIFTKDAVARSPREEIRVQRVLGVSHG